MDLLMSIVIVPNRYSDKVIRAANEVGASGATIIRARGMDNSQKKGFFNICIEPEEELIFIKANKETTDAVCSRLHDEFANSKCSGSIYILPVRTHK